MTPDKTWKGRERAIAKLLGGSRSGPGLQRLGDILTDRYPVAVEIKSGDQVPKFVLDEMAKARDASGVWLVERQELRFPVAAFGRSGMKFVDYRVMMRLGDFVGLLDAIGERWYTRGALLEGGEKE